MTSPDCSEPRRKRMRAASRCATFATRLARLPALIGALVSIASGAALAFEPFVVRDIRVEGVQRTEAGTVFSYLPVKVGERIDDEKAAQAVKALFATGFFRDVRLERQGDVLVVIVQERPTISRIDITGNTEFDTDTLKKALKDIGLAEARIFDRSALERAEQEMKRQYITRGKYAAQVTTTITPQERNRVAINFNVDEGESSKIARINIVGAQAFSEKQLLNEMTLTTPGWLTWYTKNDQYSKQKLQADLETLRSYYQNRGYLEFNVDSTQVSITPDKQDIYITVNITEGPRYTVSDVHLAGEMNVGNRVARAFRDVDGDVDVLLVRRDRHLCRVDVELEIAAVLVVASQRLEVRLQLLLRVLVVLRVPGEPTRRRERHLVEQLLLAERLGTDDVDARDLRGFAFVDVEVDRDAVALLRRDRRRHLRRVLAARDVLALHLLLGALERGAVEDARLGEADVLQRLLQRVGVELLVAGDIDAADRRALLHDDDEHVTLALEPHVAEEAGREQRLHRLRRLLVVDALADFHRQVAEHRARLGALHAFDADVAHDERLERERGAARDRDERADQRGQPGEARRECRTTGNRPHSFSTGLRTIGRGH